MGRDRRQTAGAEIAAELRAMLDRNAPIQLATANGAGPTRRLLVQPTGGAICPTC